MKLSKKTFFAFSIIVVILITFAMVTLPKDNTKTTITKIRYIKHFDKCNHENFKEETVRGTAYTKDDINKNFPEYTSKINGNVLELTKNENSYCERHFYAYLSGNIVNIIRLNDNFTVKQFTIIPSTLSKKELSELKKGIKLFDNYELTNFIEDYTS